MGPSTCARAKAQKLATWLFLPKATTFFSDATAGRSPAELLFTRENGERWGHGNQGWYVKAANEKGNIDPPIHFHLLRHTWASLAVMNAVPLMVVARNLGHVDTRMVERVYGHLAPSLVADAVRQGAPRFV